MGIFNNFFENNDSNEKKNTDNSKLRLRKKELDIVKNKVQKGEVELGKEIVVDGKVVDINAPREEVINERRNFNNETSNLPMTDEKTMRVTTSEGIYEISIVTGETSTHKGTI